MVMYRTGKKTFQKQLQCSFFNKILMYGVFKPKEL